MRMHVLPFFQQWCLQLCPETIILTSMWVMIHGVDIACKSQYCSWSHCSTFCLFFFNLIIIWVVVLQPSCGASSFLLLSMAVSICKVALQSRVNFLHKMALQEIARSVSCLHPLLDLNSLEAALTIWHTPSFSKMNPVIKNFSLYITFSSDFATGIITLKFKMAAPKCTNTVKCRKNEPAQINAPLTFEFQQP